ncbi:MAG: TonB-dependent receptor, partial [Flavisolibacter sp.]|nr:TonB-dependent receptor [Flavisolibacter sp.]
LEQTISKGQQKTTGSSFERDYLQLFPTAYLQYKATDQHNFGMNYGRRIRRPNYSSLNPFIRFIDRYTYNKGNPDLRPQLSHQVEMSHSYKNIITTTLNFSTSTDIIQQILEQKGQDAYMTLANLATLTQYGLSINANKALTKWWTSSLFINVFHNRFEGMINNEPILISGARFLLNGTQQFKITKSFSAELSGNFRSAGVQGVLRTEAVWMMNAGISKQVLKNNGTIRLAVRDMFYTRVQKAFARYANVDASFQERDDSRTLTIGFSYRFSKGKTEAQRKRTQGSAGEEQGRAGMD